VLAADVYLLPSRNREQGAGIDGLTRGVPRISGLCVTDSGADGAREREVARQAMVTTRAKRRRVAAARSWRLAEWVDADPAGGREER
jgi:hypothetical protein